MHPPPPRARPGGRTTADASDASEKQTTRDERRAHNTKGDRVKNGGGDPDDSRDTAHPGAWGRVIGTDGGSPRVGLFDDRNGK